MKKTFIGLMTIVVAMSISSCSKLYYQVCTTKPSDASIFSTNSEMYVFEDENVKITYDFWAKQGNRGFSIYNKTDKYIYMANYNSSLSSTIIGSEGEWAIGDYSNSGIIPPHNYRLIEADETISKYVFLSEGLKERVNHSESKSFTKDNTPLVFTNHINYYYYDENKKMIEKTLVHSFYVDRVTNYAQKDYIKMESKYIEKYDVLDNGKWKIAKGIRYLPVNRKGFFNTYIK